MMIRPYGIIVVENGRVNGDDAGFRVHQGIDDDQGDGNDNHHNNIMIVKDGVTDRNH